jgi:hypothetical protein
VVAAVDRMTWATALLVASSEAMLIGVGYVYWYLARELTAEALACGEAWFWIVLKFVAAAAFIGGLGYAGASGMHCDPGEHCYYEDFTGGDPEGAFRRWMILALIVGACHNLGLSGLFNRQRATRGATRISASAAGPAGTPAMDRPASSQRIGSG